MKAELAAIVEDDNRAARHLAARTGGRRNRDQRATFAVIFGLPPRIVA